MTALYRTPGVYVEPFDHNPNRMELGRTDVAGFIGIAERGPLHIPVKIESERQFQTVFGERLPGGYLGYAVGGFFDNGGRTCWVVRVADPAQATAARVRVFISVGNPRVLEATSPGMWGNSIVIAPVWGRDRITRLVARAPDNRIQTIDLDATTSEMTEVEPRVDGNLLGVPEYDLPELTPDTIVRLVPDDPWVSSHDDARTGSFRLSGGTDGLTTLTTEHFSGHPEREVVWGIDALERVDGVSFVAVPDLMAGQDLWGPASQFRDEGAIQDAQLKVIASCMRRRDRMAILDLPLRKNLRQAVAYRDHLTKSSYAAVYHPWVRVDDPLRIRGIVRAIPPSGHVAGVYARSDRMQGVHKPPANEVLEGVYDAFELLDDFAHGDLNDHGINAIRAIPGRGIRVLGTGTLDPDITICQRTSPLRDDRGSARRTNAVGNVRAKQSATLG